MSVQRSAAEVGILFLAPEVLWASLCRDAQPLISRTYLAFSDPKGLKSYPVNSLYALSRYSDLLPPKLPTIAMNRAEWTSFAKKPERDDKAEPTVTVEVWKTNPRYLELRGAVNPLLLALNCRREMLEGFHVSADALWAL